MEEIGSEPATFGYAGQLYDEQTGLLFLRARYYSPSTGHFISHDTWEGDENMPMSYNMWLYGLGNPMRYTDPSGENPLAIIGGILSGVAVGAVAGRIFGECSYDLAMAGQCGCELKQKAFSMTRQEWVTNATFGGAFIGALVIPLGMAGAAVSEFTAGLTGVGALIAGTIEFAFGGFVFYVSLADTIDTLSIIINETGWTWCTVPRLAFAILGMYGGAKIMAHASKGILTASKNIVADAYNIVKLQTRWGSKVKWSGTPHINGTPGHWERIVQKADEFFLMKDVEEVYINMGMKNVTPLNGAPNNRPDIIVKYKNGIIDVYEVQSKTDSYQKLLNRCITNLATAGGNAGKWDIFTPLID